MKPFDHRHGQRERCEARKESTKRRRTVMRRGEEDKERPRSGGVTSAWQAGAYSLGPTRGAPGQKAGVGLTGSRGL